MKRTSLTASFIIVLSMFLCSCLSQEDKDILQESKLIDSLFVDQDHEVDSLAKKKGTPAGYGESVDLAEAEPCFAEFERVMPSHGILDKPTNGRMPLQPVEPIQITTRECFRSKELRKFLHRAARMHAVIRGLPDHARTSVRVVLGICTPAYALKHGDGTRIGRIIVFFATGMYNTTGDKKWVFLNLSKYRKNHPFLDPIDDKTVFDFGGLEP